jgi:hypothetical protein
MVYKHYKIINKNLYGGKLNNLLQSADNYDSYNLCDEEEKKILCSITKPFLCILNSKNPSLCFSKLD